MRTRKEIDADVRYQSFANPMRYLFRANLYRVHRPDNGDSFRKAAQGEF